MSLGLLYLFKNFSGDASAEFILKNLNSFTCYGHQPSCLKLRCLFKNLPHCSSSLKTDSTSTSATCEPNIFVTLYTVRFSQYLFSQQSVLLFLNWSLNRVSYYWRDCEIRTVAKQLFCHWGIHFTFRLSCWQFPGHLLCLFFSLTVIRFFRENSLLPNRGERFALANKRVESFCISFIFPFWIIVIGTRCVTVDTVVHVKRFFTSFMSCRVIWTSVPNVWQVEVLWK